MQQLVAELVAEILCQLADDAEIVKTWIVKVEWSDIHSTANFFPGVNFLLFVPHKNFFQVAEFRLVKKLFSKKYTILENHLSECLVVL